MSSRNSVNGVKRKLFTKNLKNNLKKQGKPCFLLHNLMYNIFVKIERPKSKQPLPENAKLVYKGIIFDTYQWEVDDYDGTKKTFEKLKRPDTVMIIPVTNDGEIILANQEQPGKQVSISYLGGRVDEGEDVLNAAKRELLEEAGLEADEWILFNAMQPVSKIEWSVYIFIARNCKKVAEQCLDGGEKIELLNVDFDKFIEMILDKDFSDFGLRIKFLEAKIDSDKMSEIKRLIIG